jgi:hypothetical protein
MSEIKYTELDFSLIKENLKTFLKSQDKFKDYNFDGSSLSILLDILAYNTGYNAFYLNMLASEMFLDSASLRESVVSRAKHLGYIPRSTRTLRAIVDYEIYFESESAVLPANLILPTTQQFFTTVDNIRYTFYPSKSTFFTKVGTRRYKITDLELVEGKRFTHSYAVDNDSTIKQRYVIPNENVDTSTLNVLVQESSVSSNIQYYALNTDITETKETDTKYFLQAYESNLFELIFGDNVLGKRPDNGNIIKIDYVASTGDGATGASVFRTEKLSGVTVVGNQTFSLTTKSSASGYSDQESIDSIKLLAPRTYEAQNRAVTKYDYETLIRKDISIAEYVRVWGGEENTPPEYGKVFCSIKPKTGTSLNYEDKVRLVNSFISPRSLVTVDVIIVDPDYIRLVIDSTVNYDSSKTAYNADVLTAKVLSSIEQYKTDNIIGFDSDFRYSKFCSYIDAADDSIVSNNTGVKIKYRVIPSLNLRNSFTVKLNNSIDTGDYNNNTASVNSSPFYYNNAKVYMSDDGQGKVLLYYYSSDNTKIVLDDQIGTVNYAAGTITISNLLVSSIADGINYIDFTVTPKVSDIIALKEQMILIEEEDVSITMLDVARLKLS